MMMRIIGGFLSGSLVAVVMVIAASQLLPITELVLHKPQPGEAVVPAGSAFNAERRDEAPVLPQTEGRPGVATAPGVSQPVTAAAPALDTTPVGTPETGAAEGVLHVPVASAAPEIMPGPADTSVSLPGAVPPAQPGVDASPDQVAPLDAPATAAATPVMTEPPASAAPDLVVAEQDAVVELPGVVQPENPAADVLPDASAPAVVPQTDSSAAVLAAPDTGSAPDVAAPGGDMAVAQTGSELPVQAGPDASPDAASGAAIPAAAPQAPARDTVLVSPTTPAAPEIVMAANEPTVLVPPAPQPVRPVADASPETATSADVPETAADAGGVVAPAPNEPAPVVGSDADATLEIAGVAPPAQPAADPVPASPPAGAGTAAETVGTLPQIDPGAGAAPDTLPGRLPAAPPSAGLAGASEISIISPDNGDESLPRIGAGPEDTAEAVEEGAGQPALVRFAVPFQNDSANPMLSIVLVDDPDVPDGPGPADLMDFPVPLAVALDPMQPESAARMAAYRAAGVEVLVLAPLPDGATPADVEVAFQGYLAAIPQAVAVMDLPSAQLQANRPRAVQVVEILAASGHGMVTYDKGLNAGLQIAEGRGVPARAVFRVFDDGSRDTGAMKRSLDQGAFRAGQAGPVVLVGKLRAESIAAITEWALGTRAATVSLAPVSAVLQAK